MQKNQINELNEIKEDIIRCHKCELGSFRTNAVPGHFPENHKDIMFVSLAPLIMEDATGKPFVDPYYRLFNKAIISVLGLTRDDYCITHCIKCFPRHIKRCGVPRPAIKKDSFIWCAEYLYKQIEIVNPKLIIPVGKDAARYFLLRKNYNFDFKKVYSSEQVIGFLSKIKSILSDKEFLIFTMHKYRRWSQNQDIYKESINHLYKIREILNEIRAGTNREDLLRNSNYIK